MTDVAILADLRPCGYVLSTRHYQYFALECIHCQRKYGHWTSFLQHLKQQHGDQEIQWLDEAICERGSEETVADEANSKREVCESVVIEMASASSPLKCEADEGLYIAEELMHTEDFRNYMRKEEVSEIVAAQIRDNDVSDSAAEANEFQLDFSKVDATTSLFIELYKDHPCLWNPADRNYSNNWQCAQARRKLVRCLNTQNVSLTLSSLKRAIAQLHRLHDDISQRFEEGLDVSDVEASYWEQCNFLKCVIAAAPSDTESEDIYSAIFSDEDETQIISDEVDSSGSMNSLAISNAEQEHKTVVRNRFAIKFSHQNKSTCDFIRCYREQPCLWDPEHGAYNNTDKRQEALIAIKVFFWKTYKIQLTNKTITSAIARLTVFYKRCCHTKREMNHVRKFYFERCAFMAKIPMDDKVAVRNISANLVNSLAISNAEQEHKTVVRNRFAIKFSHQNKSTCDFIRCYREQPCLWDPEHGAYNNTDKRQEALIAIKVFFWKTYKIQLTNKTITSAIARLTVFYKRCCHTKREMNHVRKFYFERCAFMAKIPMDDKVAVRNISANKIQFENVNSYVLHFIKLYESYPVLWDYSHPDYSGFNARRKAYEEISSCLLEDFAVEFNKEELCDAIHRLKHHYYSVENRQRQNKPLTKSDLIYLEHCKFLPPSNRKFQCHMCGKSLRTDITLQVHLLKEHDIGQLPHKCAHCEQRFAHRTTMKEHEVRAHTKQFEWFCPHCSKGFANRRDMELHELVHTGERNCVCEQCGKSFRLKHQLTEHVKVVHERVRRFKCTICLKDYLRKRHLDDHIRGHLNIRDKICGTCGKSFTNFHTLFRHKQLHSEVKRYECQVCGDRFHQLVGLNGHMKRRHKIMNNADIEKEAAALQETQSDA